MTDYVLGSRVIYDAKMAYVARTWKGSVWITFADDNGNVGNGGLVKVGAPDEHLLVLAVPKPKNTQRAPDLRQSAFPSCVPLLSPKARRAHGS